MKTRRIWLAASLGLACLLLLAGYGLRRALRPPSADAQAEASRATLEAIPTATPTLAQAADDHAGVIAELLPMVEELEEDFPGWTIIWADRLSQQVAVAAVPPSFEDGDELLPGLEVLWRGSQPFFRTVRGGEGLPRSEMEVGTVTVFLLREPPGPGQPGQAFLMVSMNQFYVHRYLRGMDADRPTWERGQHLQTFATPLVVNGIDWNAVRLLLPGRVFPSWSHYPDIPR